MVELFFIKDIKEVGQPNVPFYLFLGARNFKNWHHGTLTKQIVKLE